MQLGEKNQFRATVLPEGLLVCSHARFFSLLVHAWLVLQYHQCAASTVEYTAHAARIAGGQRSSEIMPGQYSTL